MGVRRKIIAHCNRCGVEREFDSLENLIKAKWEIVYLDDLPTLCPHCHALFLNRYDFKEDKSRELDYETESGEL